MALVFAAAFLVLAVATFCGPAWFEPSSRRAHGVTPLLEIVRGRMEVGPSLVFGGSFVAAALLVAVLVLAFVRRRAPSVTSRRVVVASLVALAATGGAVVLAADALLGIVPATYLGGAAMLVLARSRRARGWKRWGHYTLGLVLASWPVALYCLAAPDLRVGGQVYLGAMASAAGCAVVAISGAPRRTESSLAARKIRVVIGCCGGLLVATLVAPWQYVVASGGVHSASRVTARAGHVFGWEIVSGRVQNYSPWVNLVPLAAVAAGVCAVAAAVLRLRIGTRAWLSLAAIVPVVGFIGGRGRLWERPGEVPNYFVGGLPELGSYWGHGSYTYMPVAFAASVALLLCAAACAAVGLRRVAGARDRAPRCSTMAGAAVVTASASRAIVFSTRR